MNNECAPLAHYAMCTSTCASKPHRHPPAACLNSGNRARNRTAACPPPAVTLPHPTHQPTENATVLTVPPVSPRQLITRPPMRSHTLAYFSLPSLPSASRPLHNLPDPVPHCSPSPSHSTRLPGLLQTGHIGHSQHQRHARPYASRRRRMRGGPSRRIVFIPKASSIAAEPHRAEPLT